MFGANKTTASTTPFASAPVFGSTSTFGAQQTTPVFGGTGSTVFGQQSQQATGFGTGAQGQSTASSGNVPQSGFGQSTQSTTGFGQSAQSTTGFGQSAQSTTGFGQSAQSTSFGTGTGSAAFGGGTTGTAATTSSNPFGSTTTQSSPSSNIFSAALKATPSKSIFGGAGSQKATHPIFGGGSQGAAQSSAGTTSIFGAKSDPGVGGFGSATTPVFGGQTSGTQSSQNPFGGTKTAPEKTTIFQNVTSGGAFGDSSKRSFTDKKERGQGNAAASLFGKTMKGDPSTSSSVNPLFGTASTEGGGSGVQPLFGKTTAAQNKSSQLFGKSADSSPEPKVLFGGASENTRTGPPSIFGMRTETKNEPKAAFDQPQQSENEPKPLFGKSTHEAKPLFGKSTQEPKPLFGKSTQETKPLFGKTTDAGARMSRSPERRNDDTGEDEKLPRRIRNWGASRKTATGAKATGGLFGKAVAGVASTAEQDAAKEPEALEPQESAVVKPNKPTVRPLLQEPIKRPRRRTSSETADKLSIVVKNIPKMFNDKGMLKIHFSKFGKVTRVYHNAEKSGAIITYDDPEFAKKAIAKGKVIKKGVPAMALFWKAGTPAKKSSSATTTKRSEAAADKAGASQVEPMRLPTFSGDVNEELKSMSGTEDISSEEIHYLERPDINQPLKSGRDRGQGRPRSSSPAPARSEATRRVKSEAQRGTRSRSSEAAAARSTRRPRSRSPSPKPKAEPKSGMYRHASMNSLAGTVGHTAEERLDILENRDRIIRAGLGNRDNDVTTSLVLKGTCPDMCPETERYKREARRLLHRYEMLQTGLREPKVDHTKAVKEYSRSSADQEMPLPHELRPSPVLNRTMIYLLNNIVDLGEDGKWGEWFEFLWSRTRGIRKDVTQQQLCDIEAVECVEKCARFHIYSAERLCEEDPAVYDAKINSENLTKCLQTLREMYQDMEMKHKSYCRNEAEFRAYMVLMKLNEGDILRETQQLREEIRQSPPVKFVLKVYSALYNNNYIKFFKLARTGTFLNSCLMHRYFNQVRMAALRTMSKSYVPSTQPVQYQLSELGRLLAFEDEGEASNFCEHYGYYTEDGKVFLERNAFIMPESNLAPCRAIALVESKQRVSAGEVMNGGPLPPNIVIKPTSSFDERGRFTASDTTLPVQEELIPVVTDPTRVEDGQISEAHSAEAQEASQLETAKDVAKDLLVEVTDEMAVQLSTNLMNVIHSLTTDAPEILASIIKETTDSMHREISSIVINELKTDKAEKEAVARKEQLAMKARAAEQICDDLVQEGVDEAIQQVAEAQYKESQTQLKEESKHRMSEDVRNSLYNATVAEEIMKIALDFHKTEVEDKLEMLNEREERIRKSRMNNFWRKWKNAYAGRTRLKRSMLTFPPAPSMNTAREQLQEILPLSQGVRADTVHLGNSAELTLEAPPVVRLGRTANYMNMGIYKHNQRIRRERAWRPLNVVGAISQEMLDRYSNGKTSFSELHIFWKLVMSLPDENEMLSDWLKAKFKKGTVPNTHPGSKVSLLSLYSAAVENSRRPTSLHVCISGCHGDLDEGDVWEIEQKCHFLGTSAILFVLDITEDADTEETWWLSEQLRLSRLMQAKPVHPALPLVILIHQSENSREYSKEEISENLNLGLCVESGSVSDYKFVQLGDDIEDPVLTEELASCIDWLSLHCPKEPEIMSKDIVEYVEEKMGSLFTTPVYQNLSLRRKTGLVDQAPEVLLDVYNAVIDHMVKQVTDPALKKISWPVPEFTAVYSDLPHADWNKEETLAQLEELLPHLLLPDPEPAESDGWESACDEVWQFIEMVVESGEGNKVELYSRIRWLLRKAKHEFGELSWFVEGTACCPTAFNLPWTELIMACVNYRIGGIKMLIADSQEENGGINRVHYFTKNPHRFVYPKSWTHATKELTHGTPKLETTLVIASQKRKLDTSTVSETSPKQARKDSTSPEATSLDRSQPDSATPRRLELSKMDDHEIEADDSAYKLSVSLANEKSETAKYEEYLQSLVAAGESDSFLWDIGAGFSPVTPNTPSGSQFEKLRTQRTSFSQTPTGRLFRPSASRYSFEEGDLESRGGTLNETLEHLQESIRSSREADKLYEMKLRSLLIETP